MCVSLINQIPEAPVVPEVVIQIETCVICESQYVPAESDCDTCIMCPQCVQTSTLTISNQEGRYYMFSFACSRCNTRHCLCCTSGVPAELDDLRCEDNDCDMSIEIKLQHLEETWKCPHCVGDQN
jgi:hypothetical protein